MLAHNIENRIPPINYRGKKNLGILIVMIAIGVLLFLAGLSAFWYQSTVNSPNKGGATKRVFVAKSGEGLEKIATDLRGQNLISNAFIFELYMKGAGLSGKIQAGEYEIPGNLNMKDLAEEITLGKIVTNKITIPEGWSNDQIGDYLASHTTITKAGFLVAAGYEPSRDKYGFLSGLTAGNSLQGFLFPDTYQLPLHPTADGVIEKMLANFNKKYTAELKASESSVGLSTEEVVTLASIVEREVPKTADRKIVAGIFENRLANGMPLQSDITVLYAEGRNKGEVTTMDTNYDSPYNTYLHVGLPPTPIDNPSIQSIEAVLAPTKTNYLYFLAAPDGTVYYATTVDQHNANKAKYLK